MVEQQFGGNWTEDKLERVRKYLKAYTTIMNNQRDRNGNLIFKFVIFLSINSEQYLPVWQTIRYYCVTPKIILCICCVLPRVIPGGQNRRLKLPRIF